MTIKKTILLSLLLIPSVVWGQMGEFNSELLEDEISFSGDIFTDFNEELEASQILEDERFYRYGRFFSANFGLGMTGYTGNRGRAYDDFPPTYNVSVVYFFNFHVAFTLGVQYSRHAFFIDTPVNNFREELLGTVEVSMVRPFFGFRYYIDTSDLGTAITYANPYLTGRFEYWYQTNKYINRPEEPSQSGGGIGTGLGMGLEFPIRFKEAYLGVEFIYHWVNFFDKFTQDYAEVPQPNDQGVTSEYGFSDLTGDAYSVLITYNITW